MKSKMNFDETTSTSGRENCQEMLDAATPSVFVHNAFRITGLLVDAPAREIKRRIDDLKYAEELGDADDEHSHAYALDPPPSLERIQEATKRLNNPEHRIVQEFFWFWPQQWGEGKNDSALSELKHGDIDAAFQIWHTALSSGTKKISIIAKHNLAVMYQLVALDSELIAIEGEIEPDQQQELNKYWKACFKWWEELTDDEDFWSLVTERIRMLDDPRLKTGFYKRMRATFPEALDKINAMQAMAFFEKGKLEQGRMHLAYMQETHQGMDNVPKTLAMVTKPLKSRVESLVDRARSLSKQQPHNAAQSATDLLNGVEEPVNLLLHILPESDIEQIDLCDSIADTCLDCIELFARESKNGSEILEILNSAKKYAVSKETRSRLEWKEISNYCEEAIENVDNDPHSGALVARELIEITPGLFSKHEQTGILNTTKLEIRNVIAGTIMSCSVTYGNKTEDWTVCIDLLEYCLKIVVDSELKERIQKNLGIVRKNHKLYGNLTPIKSAPSLNVSNGGGYTLYGCTDKDPETGSYLSTYYFVIFGIPVFPITRYRVIPIINGYRFLGKAPLRLFDKWHLAVSLLAVGWFILFLIGIFNDSGSSSSSSSRSTSNTPVRSTTTYPSRPTSRPVYNYQQNNARTSLSSEIEEGKVRASSLESQLEKMDTQIENLEKRMNRYESLNMINEYNNLVPEINTLINRRKFIYDQYSRIVDEINRKVDLYNSR